MFWPQSFWEWIVIAAIVFFMIQAYRTFREDHKKDSMFEPFLDAGRDAHYLVTQETPGLFQKIARSLIHGNNRRKR